MSPCNEATGRVKLLLAPWTKSCGAIMVASAAAKRSCNVRANNKIVSCSTRGHTKGRKRGYKFHFETCSPTIALLYYNFPYEVRSTKPTSLGIVGKYIWSIGPMKSIKVIVNLGKSWRIHFILRPYEKYENYLKPGKSWVNISSLGAMKSMKSYRITRVKLGYTFCI